MIRKIVYYDSTMICRFEKHIFRELKNGEIAYLTVITDLKKHRLFDVITKQDMIDEIKHLKYIGGYEKEYKNNDLLRMIDTLNTLSDSYKVTIKE